MTNMCIVMYMPTRNVYVSEDDVSLFTEAGEIAGSLSSAVVEALRDYVKKRGHLAEGYQEIELKLSTGGADRRVTFVGRRLVRLTRPDHLQKEDPVMAEQARAALVIPALEVLDI